MSRIEEIRSLLIKGKMKDINKLVIDEVEENANAREILDDGLLAGMDDIAKKWAEGKAFIPEVLIGARCMNAAIALLEPYLVGEDIKPLGKVVFGTVEGDLHDIGKNLCTLMLKANGFEIVDLGVDVKAEVFVEAVEREKPDFLCLSSLLTTSMHNMKDVIDKVEAASLRNNVKIAVGGAPLTQEFADKIGADIFTPNAVELASTLVSQVA